MRREAPQDVHPVLPSPWTFIPREQTTEEKVPPQEVRLVLPRSSVVRANENFTRLAALGTRSLGLQTASPVESRPAATQTAKCTTDMGSVQHWRRSTTAWPSRRSRQRAQPSPTPLSARTQFRQESPWMRDHFRTAQSETLLLLNETGSCSPTSAEPQQWPSRAALSLGIPPRGERSLTEPSVVTSHEPSCADIVAPCCLQQFPRGYDRNTE